MKTIAMVVLAILVAALITCTVGTRVERAIDGVSHVVGKGDAGSN